MRSRVDSSPPSSPSSATIASRQSTVLHYDHDYDLLTAASRANGTSAGICGYNEGMKRATSSRATVVGVRDLKNRLSAHLDRVKGGEEITVTEHGRPIARLSRVGADVDRMTALVDAGIGRPPAATARRLPAERVKVTGSGSIDHDVAAQRR